MKLLASFLFSGALANVDDCFVCEYAGVAKSEEQALLMLSGSDKDTGAEDTTANLEFNPCILGKAKATADVFDAAVTNGDIKIYTSDTAEQNDATKIFDSTATNCIAKFFLYEARDIKRW